MVYIPVKGIISSSLLRRLCLGRRNAPLYHLISVEIRTVHQLGTIELVDPVEQRHGFACLSDWWQGVSFGQLQMTVFPSRTAVVYIGVDL